MDNNLYRLGRIVQREGVEQVLWGSPCASVENCLKRNAKYIANHIGDRFIIGVIENGVVPE